MGECELVKEGLQCPLLLLLRLVLCLHLNESSEGAKGVILGTLDWRGLVAELQLALGLFHLELSASMLVAGLVGC